MLSRSREWPRGLPRAPRGYCPDHLQLGTAGLRIAGKMSVEHFPREMKFIREGKMESGTKGKVRVSWRRRLSLPLTF